MSKIQVVSITLLLMIIFQGCDTWEKDININPNAPQGLLNNESDSDIDPSVFMVPMLNSTVSGINYVSWNVMSAVCAYHGKTKSLSQGNRHKSWHAFDDSNLWPSLYNALRVVKNMRNAAIKADDQRYKAIADIWECYTISMITNLWGDVPYTDAISDNPPLLSKYDKQSEIYPALLEKLKAAGLALNSQDMPINSSTDLIFGGDVLKWKKFSNMLRLRLAMYMSDVAQTQSIEIISEILDDPEKYPLMVSNADNALFKHDAVERTSIFYWLSKAKIEEAPFSNVFIERLISLSDPRLPVMARPVRNVHTNSNQQVLPSNPGVDKYAGHLFGITTDNAHAAQWNGGFAYASALGDFFRKEDLTGVPLQESASTPFFIAFYSEQEFFIAEAIERGFIAGNANSHYNNAIESSIAFYKAGFDTEKYKGAFADKGFSSVSEYINQPSVKYTGGRDKLTLIAEQKWIASFMLGFEPYFDHRRTMLPNIRISSGAENTAANGSGTKFPSRAAYSDSEMANNPINVEKARLTGFDEPITTEASRNTVRMWIITGKDLQMPIFKEPVFSSEYPYLTTLSGSGTNFKKWYDENWNQIFWWKNE